MNEEKALAAIARQMHADGTHHDGCACGGWFYEDVERARTAARVIREHADVAAALGICGGQWPPRDQLVDVIAQAVADAQRHVGPYGTGPVGRRKPNGGHVAKAHEIADAIEAALPGSPP